MLYIYLLCDEMFVPRYFGVTFILKCSWGPFEAYRENIDGFRCPCPPPPLFILGDRGIHLRLWATEQYSY